MVYCFCPLTFCDKIVQEHCRRGAVDISIIPLVFQARTGRTLTYPFPTLKAFLHSLPRIRVFYEGKVAKCVLKL